MEKVQKILFSIDLEEFDIPEEYGCTLEVNRKLQVSYDGMKRLEEILDTLEISSTIFTTAFWATNYPDFVRQLSGKHEIASHTYFHNVFELQHLAASRERLEHIIGRPVTGLRMPRMQQVNDHAITEAGYAYESSMHPTWLPGRYNHFRKERCIHQSNQLWHMPVSVTPVLRIPVFWLSFKNFPVVIYKRLLSRILHHDGYLIFYVHPWEFTSLRAVPLPGYIKRIDGERLLLRLKLVLTHLKQEGSFVTHSEFIKYIENERTLVSNTHVR